MTLLEIFAGINFRDFLAKYRQILNFIPQNFLPFRVMEVGVAVKSIFFHLEDPGGLTLLQEKNKELIEAIKEIKKIKNNRINIEVNKKDENKTRVIENKNKNTTRNNLNLVVVVDSIIKFMNSPLTGKCEQNEAKQYQLAVVRPIHAYRK